jgi:hypothetical protein
VVAGSRGTSQQGSERDFYASLQAEAIRRGKGKGAPNTAHLLPQQVDRERLEAELAVRAVQAIREFVLKLVVASLHDGQRHSLELQGHRITALVYASNATEAYLAISAEGFVRPEMIAIMLDAVPGIDRDDWQIEPDGVAGILPASGQLIWSAIIPPEAQADILQRFDSPEATEVIAGSSGTRR